MKMVRRQDLNDVERLLLQHLLVIIVERRLPLFPPLQPPSSGLAIKVANRRELGIRIVQISQHMFVADDAEADEAYSEHVGLLRETTL